MQIGLRRETMAAMNALRFSRPPSFLAVLGLALGLVGWPAPAQGQAARRPNFLFVFADDQRWDAMGVVQREQGERGRFPWFQTPSMDRLAAEGVRFRNAFVVCALCSPSRAAFLTGRYNHSNEVIDNHTPFPDGAVTHATLLRAAGYRTGYTGKWHMDGQTGKRPGFDFSASFIGHARYQDAPFEVDGEKRETRGWVDDVSTDFAIEFLLKSKEHPFLLVVGYKSPHGPFDPPARLKDRFAGAKARPAPNLGSLPPFPRGGRAPETIDPKAAEVEVNLGYFRCVAGIDENLGRLLTALDELKLAEDTVLVYSSDNGFYLGEHGLGDKRSAYEESIRIPLLLRYPRLVGRGKVADAMVLNIDLAPTLLDLAGLPVPPEMHGRSWRPLLEGKLDGTALAWRTSFLYEYFYERNFFTPTVTAVRTESAKLIEYPGHGDWTELYDLKLDPYETRNLARDSAAKALRDALAAEHGRLSKELGYRVPEGADRPDEARPREAGPAAARPSNAFVLEYDFSKDEGDRILDSSGKGNHGTARSAPVVDGREGRKARRFDGKGWIDVPKSPTLDPSVGPWTIEAVVKAEAPSGVVLARGGSAQGYALLLSDGVPFFTVRAGDRRTTIGAETPVTGRWVHLAAVAGADRVVRLYVDGALASSGPLQAFVARDPSDAMEIGADRGSQVLGDDRTGPFVGLVESVRLFSGGRSAEDVRKDAAARGLGPKE
ncbi:MAG: sulfatase-like hydrolase/transferase [Planctomycetes bacterium]|nr:sulfatase-like hydrolase/transferase [Planctomycetota bacterium]